MPNNEARKRKFEVCVGDRDIYGAPHRDVLTLYRIPGTWYWYTISTPNFLIYYKGFGDGEDIDRFATP